MWIDFILTFSRIPFPRPSKNCGIPPTLMPTCQNALPHLSCSPSQSWFSMLRVSWCRWTDCQGAMRSDILVGFRVFDVLTWTFLKNPFFFLLLAKHAVFLLGNRCPCFSFERFWNHEILECYYIMVLLNISFKIYSRIAKILHNP